MLEKMKFKGYVWPNNPSSLEVETKRRVCSIKLPLAGFKVQELGESGLTIRGEGEFAGSGAYESFRRLAEVFSQKGSGVLEHPVWPPVRVHFTRLRLLECTQECYVRYSFEFEKSDSQDGTEQQGCYFENEKYLSAQGGETLSTFSQRVHTAVEVLKKLNGIDDADAALADGQLIKVS